LFAEILHLQYLYFSSPLFERLVFEAGAVLAEVAAEEAAEAGTMGRPGTGGATDSGGRERAEKGLVEDVGVVREIVDGEGDKKDDNEMVGVEQTKESEGSSSVSADTEGDKMSGVESSDQGDGSAEGAISEEKPIAQREQESHHLPESVTSATTTTSSTLAAQPKSETRISKPKNVADELVHVTGKFVANRILPHCLVSH
jgi:hypothetical protein